eukprot:2712881-Pleurochrysis_carterae.AAC.1
MLLGVGVGKGTSGRGTPRRPSAFRALWHAFALRPAMAAQNSLKQDFTAETDSEGETRGSGDINVTM